MAYVAHHTSYSIQDFEYDKAVDGALCIITNSSGGNVIEGSGNFEGVGIVRKHFPNRLVLTYNGKTYWFKEDGTGLNTSIGFNLKLATISDPSVTGNLVNDVITQSITRSNTNSTFIDSINPKDHFAIQALQSMMNKIEDPSILSSAEIDLYCKAAYLWANNMMKNAASQRCIVDDNNPSVSGNVSVTSLNNNTEKLLNNLIVELSNTNKASTIGTWSKIIEVEGVEPGTTQQTQINIQGDYTDDWVLNHSLNETTYSTIAAAEADGWSWTAKYYSERQTIEDLPDIKLKDVTMSGIEALIKQLRGGHSVTVPGEGDDPDVTTTEYYNESFFEHYLQDTINTYLSSGIGNTKVGLKDLIAATNLSTVNKAVDTTLNNEMLKIGIKEMPNSLTVSNSGSVNIGSSGLGSYSSPIYVEILGNSGSGSNTGRGLIFSSTNYGVFQNPQKGYYYKVSGSLSSVAITLPAASSTNNQAINIIVFNISCLPSAPFSITPTGSDTISYKSANPGYTLSGEYEIECTDVGDGWIIDVTIIV